MDQAHLDLDIPTASFARKRDFHGYAQYRESEGDAWRFYVCGFYGPVPKGHESCSVMMFDETETDVPIDGDSRIFIRGRWYGHQHWDH